MPLFRLVCSLREQTNFGNKLAHIEWACFTPLVYARIEHIRSPSDMATSEEGVPSDEGAQAVGGAPAEETASDDIDCRRAASSEGGAGMDDGARVRVYVKGRMMLRITQPRRKERSAMLERSCTKYGSPPL